MKRICVLLRQRRRQLLHRSLSSQTNDRQGDLAVLLVCAAAREHSLCFCTHCLDGGDPFRGQVVLLPSPVCSSGLDADGVNVKQIVAQVSLVALCVSLSLLSPHVIVL